MLKHEVRKLVRDRAAARYRKSVVTVLDKIIDLIEVADFKTDHIDNLYSRPMTISKMEYLTNLEWHTVKTAINTLLEDGVITRNRYVADSYRVNEEPLRAMPSKYLASLPRKLERKIMKAVRMRLQRRQENAFVKKVLHDGDGTITAPPWAEEHEKCLCTPHFCSHPSAI